MLGVEFELGKCLSEREVRVWGEGLHGAREQGAGAFGGAEGGEEKGGIVEPDGRNLRKFFDGGLE